MLAADYVTVFLFSLAFVCFILWLADFDRSNYMRTCIYCNYVNGSHNPDCPIMMPEKRQLWELGWSEARMDKVQTSQDSTYLLGWYEGMAAREEFERFRKQGATD